MLARRATFSVGSAFEEGVCTSSDARSPRNVTMIPLGLFSLGVSVFLLSGFLYGAIPGLGPFVAYGLLTGGLGLLITGFWAFRADNIFGGVSMTTIGGLFASGILFAVTVVGLLIALASFKANIPRQGSVLLLLLFLTLAVDWAASAFHVQSAFKVAGVIGIITALMAWAGGFTRLMMES